mmetsp:Transcript_40488/g.90813  ORF Transcript_40488/g.90813 Transcript_40488/m.90813 type:complete len:432 (-) Transcript_40488:4-1299(-)|eukprot:5450904-Amphidinium_carterae.1
MSRRALCASLWDVAAPEVLSTCASFWALDQRLAAGSISKRWHEALAVPEAWEVVEVPPDMMVALSKLLRRFGRYVRRLRLAMPAGSYCADKLQHLPAELAEVSKCPRLEYLALRGLKGQEGFLAGTSGWSACNTLRVLELHSLPYFSLSGYNHHTGVRVATTSAAWIQETFPHIDELVCEYLELGDVTFKSLKKLSLVAIVQCMEKGGQWNSTGCSRHLPRIAAAAPDLECLVLREPKVHLGRMSRRPGQTVADLVQMCRRFCATQVETLRGIARIFTCLRVLEVDTVQEDGPDGEIHAMGLDEFLGVDRRRHLTVRLGDGSPGSAEWLETARSSSGLVQVHLVSSSSKATSSQRSNSDHCAADEIFSAGPNQQAALRDLLAKVAADSPTAPSPSSSSSDEETEDAVVREVRLDHTVVGAQTNAEDRHQAE